jgi:MFS family permease
VPLENFLLVTCSLSFPHIIPSLYIFLEPLVPLPSLLFHSNPANLPPTAANKSMTTSPVENHTPGTPSPTRDASRIDIDSNSQLEGLFTHTSTLSLTSHFSNASEATLQAFPTADENEKHHDVINANEGTVPPKRPTLPFRRTTTVSTIAAAPYGGGHATADLEKRGVEDASGRARSSSSSSTTPTLHEIPLSLMTASRVSTDAYGNTYPEGGLEAYLCVLGSFCGLMAALGLMNSIGTYQAYLSAHQLSSQTESAIGWIFGIYAFLSFFCGIQIGPIFDAKGPRYLVLAGSVLLMATYLLLGICTAYYHFVLVFGVMGGLGTSLVFTPSVAAVGHFFLAQRGQWTGLACVGGSLAGIIYPLTLQALFPRIGWAWSTRVLALINLILLIVANLCIKSRLPPKKATRESILPDFRIFRDRIFALTTLGVFFVEWGLFVPLSYLTSYAIQEGVNPTFAYQLLAILNVGSCFGRYLPGLVADRLGYFNAMVSTIFLCFLSVLALWLPAGGSVPVIVVFALVFGFASGTGISLTPVCVGKLCRIENYGRYYATCYTLVSFGSMTGIPIAGQLVSACGGRYWGLIVFTGCSYGASLGAFVLARGLGGGWVIGKKY